MIHLPADSSRIRAAVEHLLTATTLDFAVEIRGDEAHLTVPLSFGQQLVWQIARSLAESEPAPSLQSCIAHLDGDHISAVIVALGMAAGQPVTTAIEVTA